MSSSSTSALVHHVVLETSNFSTTAIWIIDERNSTLINLDAQLSSVRIMWYRFLLVIIIFVTAAGNILVCLAIARERKLQNTTNYFLMSLAVADCLVAILVMPMGMVAEALGYFPLPGYACVIFATMDVLCCTSSIWHMSTMSMDRYFTIRFPFRYGRNKTRRIMLLKIVAVWAISAAVSSPVFVLGMVDQRHVFSNGTCAPNNDSFKLYGSIFAFYIPFIIMIITYALTMRSLRNVLVNKQKYNRERRRDQTFRPLAQIINQYAEIAHGLRRTSASKTNKSASNIVVGKAPYTIITTATSPTDPHGPFFSSNIVASNSSPEGNVVQYGSMNTAINHHHHRHHHHDPQHLTISYSKSGSSKRRQQQQQQQQQVSGGIGTNRPKNENDMSTLYEITEYSKSTSSSHETASVAVGGVVSRRSLTVVEQQQVTDRVSSSVPNPTASITAAASTVNNRLPLAEEENSSTSETELQQSDYLQIASARSPCTSTSSSSVVVAAAISKNSLPIPFDYCLAIIQRILQYYALYFVYRPRPLAIENVPRNNNQSRSEPIKFHQTTSTSSIDRMSSSIVSTVAAALHQSVSTQTSPLFLPPRDAIHSTSAGGLDNRIPSIRRRFPFTRNLITSPSLFANFFRTSPTTPVRSSQCSTKSSVSWGQRSSAGSSSYPTRPQQHHCSSSLFRHIESEMDIILANQQRSRGSSSSSLLRTTRRSGNRTYSHWHKPLRRRQYNQHYPRRAYMIAHAHSAVNLRQHRQISSTTNTNSSDSSSAPRYHTRLLTNPSQQPQQRLRDEDIVAANERKALRVLMIIFCVFVTLWTPFFLCTIISAVCDRCREQMSPTIWFSITWLGYSSSMANPFIYTIFSDAFRRAFINLILCRPSDSLLATQLSTKLSFQKNGIPQHMHQQYIPRRSPNHNEYSATSTQIPLHYPNTNDATIYVNRCTSETFR